MTYHLTGDITPDGETSRLVPLRPGTGWIEVPTHNPAIAVPPGLLFHKHGGSATGHPVVAMEVDHEFPDLSVIHVVESGGLVRYVVEEGALRYVTPEQAYAAAGYAETA